MVYVHLQKKTGHLFRTQSRLDVIRADLSVRESVVNYIGKDPVYGWHVRPLLRPNLEGVEKQQERFTKGYETVARVHREVTAVYKDSEIDWNIVHDAGCTRDDTDLPHHMTTPNDLDRLITGTFRSFLAALPAPPTIVTIARSSEDDYCPMEDVEQIQMGVLDELKERIESVDIRLAYQEKEDE